MGGKRVQPGGWRKSFSKIEKVVDLPNLIDIQRKSYERFLQANVPPAQREDTGLQGAFKSVFPIQDFNETASLEFVSYSLGEPKYSVEECLQRGMTYAVPVRITVRLIVWEPDKDKRRQTIRDVKEQEVYFGEIPLMTEKGTFIINGTERVIVSQLHRSPGIFYEHDKGKTHASGVVLYSARIIPMRGSWLDLEFDAKDILYVRIDKRRKFPVTVLLKALGYTVEELIRYFYPIETLEFEDGRIYRKLPLELLIGTKASDTIALEGDEEPLVKRGGLIRKKHLKALQAKGVDRVPLHPEDLPEKLVASPVVDPNTGEVLLDCLQNLTQEKLNQLLDRGVKRVEVIFIDDRRFLRAMADTLLLDRVEGEREAILEIYKRLRPGNPPTEETAREFFHNLFFNPRYYDLSSVGRWKLNRRLGISMEKAPLSLTALRREDIMEAVRYLLALRAGQGQIDDIDHLGNRRVKAVGELIENQYRIGLVRMERAIKERMSLQEIETLMPHDLINAKPVSAVVKEFFGSSQLSQFMDQTNPLSEITHKRRLSALGPGGLTRERAGFEVRDVHPTHYGRICPIETPEGPNIGLIVSLSTYARVNDMGFIETPYRVVKDGKVTREIEYLTALDEEKHVIAQANAPLDSEGRFTSELVSVRYRGGEFALKRAEEVDRMDVSPNQLVSVAASLIPFLENDDANRALMGSNMQRQAVPLLVTEVPLVGTGMEHPVARDSGVAVVARRSGVVESVDASRIVVRVDGETQGSQDPGIDIYNLIKYQRSNQNTCINQKPIVRKGQRVEAGQIIADGPSTYQGELALGRNVLVAFMPWGGYNFEDSILVSERLVRDDVFTSVHIEEFEVMARDTKLGKEEITRDIPNIGDENLRNLDESGIVAIGVEVKPGDILVGKVTPKGESQLSPEEKLLRAIFGEKAGDIRDTSLKVPPGVEGTVIAVRVFSRKGVDKDERTRELEDEEISRLVKDQDDEIRIIQRSTMERMRERLEGKHLSAEIRDHFTDEVLGQPGQIIDRRLLDRLPMHRWMELRVQEDPDLSREIRELYQHFQEQVDLIKVVFDERILRLKRGDELPPGVIKMVKVYVAIKRKLSVGDKMAGRHGNKGVISRILPEEDMPYFEDGTPVDIVLNPLGVPSRMNVGQVLETHLGWAAKGLGEQIGKLLEAHAGPEAIRKRLSRIYSSPAFDALLNDLSDDELMQVANKLKAGIPMATPVFDGATEPEIHKALMEAGLPVAGQAVLYDGRTGEPFHRPVTVGMMYMMKLHHLVDDKIHARSIGPYSLVTQQPLGGKAQFGGQRLGEMEVWAMEAYGAAYTLQEFLTVKSDDIAGRNRMYESIVKGDYRLEPGLPESFNVLMRELQSLGLNVELLEDGDGA
ncbi:MAG: DNA-directed RNA polymerase subunit beta [Thermodesulfobacteriota bacterium]